MIGKKLGPYEILEQIGKGGMATVYRARQTSVDRDVAIKIMHKNILDNQDAILRFQREARLIARLEHSHILPVYDFDGAFDPPYIVMRYLDTGTLKEVMSQGLLPHEEVNFLVRQVGSALDYAHRMGIIHRDIKPSNIMIDREGNAFVTDLGIARMANSEYSIGEQITETGVIIGTPDYMSPEQAQGGDNIDHKTDIYAFGIVVFEMLTGQLPYQASTPLGVLIMQMQDPIPSACELNDKLPPAIDVVIARVLAKDPGDRYQSAADFAEAVTQVLGGTIAGIPLKLREAAQTTILPALLSKDTNSQSTPSEQNKSVTAIYCNAAEYAEILADERGAEYADEVLTKLWDNAEAIVSERSGIVISRADNSFMALWGAESSNEDDAEQVIRAALDIQKVVHEQMASILPDEDSEASLPLNIGIHTGLALLSPSSDTNSLGVSGAAISLTNRLAQQAYGTILITHDTYLLVQGVFTVVEDAPLRMRGKRENLSIYCVKSARPRAFRLTSRGIEGIDTRLIGRDAELKVLENAFLDVIEESETQGITIFGEAGFGKSRLLYDFSTILDLHPSIFRFFQARATGSMSNRPYALIRDLMSFRFEIHDNDSLDVVTKKITEGVANLLGQSDDEMAHFIGFICGFDMFESPYVKPLLGDPQQPGLLGRRKFIQLLTTIAREVHPVVILLEDIHHADDASLNLITELLNEDDSIALMLVSTSRPDLLERRPDWGSGLAFHNRIELRALDRHNSRSLVNEILQKVAEIPADFRDLIVERGQGNPYFIEEIIKILIDDNVIIKASEEEWQIEHSRLDSLRLPPTLMGILQSRYDTLLYPEKVILQRASVIGRIFHDEALEVLDVASDMQVGNIEELLADLLERGFIERRETTTIEGAKEYIFSSIMMQEMIYNSLLRRHKVLYHHLVAKWLVFANGERIEEYYATLANHYEEAEMPRVASQFFDGAGEATRDKGGANEAVMYFRKALSLIDENESETISISNKLGDVLIQLGRFEEAKSILVEPLKSIIYEDNEGDELVKLLLNLASIARFQGQSNLAEELLEEGLELLDRTESKFLSVRYKSEQGLIARNRGDYERAKLFLDEAIKESELNHFTSERLLILNYRATVDYLSGNTDAAISRFDEIIIEAKAIGHQSMVARILANLTELLINLHRWDEAKEACAEALKTASEISYVKMQTASLNLLARIRLALSEREFFNALYDSFVLANNNGIVQNLHDCIIVYGHFQIKNDDVEQGLLLLGLVDTRRNVTDDTRQFIQRVLGEFELDEDAITSGMAKGVELDFDEMVERVLEELGQEIDAGA